MNGTTPTSGSSLYTGPITVNAAVTIMAIAVKDGMMDSNIAAYSFAIKQKAPAPYISPASGVVAYGTQIYIGRSSVYEPRVMYTTDGSEPTSSHGSMCLPWDSPKIIGTVKGDMTIKAITVKSNMTISDVATRNYICKAAAPTASLPSGLVPPKSIVTLSSIVPDCTIYYTTNGSDPSDVNNPSRKIFASDTKLVINRQITIKAVTVKDGIPDSDTASFTYDLMKLDTGYYFDGKLLKGFSLTNNYSFIPDAVLEYMDITEFKSMPDYYNYGNMRIWYATTKSDDGICSVKVKSLEDNPSTILLNILTEKHFDNGNIITIHVYDIYGMTSSIEFRAGKDGKLEPLNSCD